MIQIIIIIVVVAAAAAVAAVESSGGEKSSGRICGAVQCSGGVVVIKANLCPFCARHSLRSLRRPAPAVWSERLTWRLRSVVEHPFGFGLIGFGLFDGRRRRSSSSIQIGKPSRGLS